METKKIFKIGYLTSVSIAPLLVAARKGWFEEKGFVIKPKRQLGWGALSDRFLSGNLDGALVPPSLLIAAANESESRSIECKACFAAGFGGAGLLGRPELHGYPQGGFKTSELRFGTTAPFSPDSHIVKRWMRKTGLVHAGVDLVSVPIVATQAIQLIEENFIDLFGGYEPWVKIASTKGGCISLPVGDSFEISDANRMFAFRNEAIRARGHFYSNFAGILKRAGEWICDKENSEELLDILGPESWNLTDEEIISLFHPEEPSEGRVVRFSFKRGGLVDVKVRPEDVATAWKSYCLTLDSEQGVHDLNVPQWVTDLFLLSELDS